MPIINYNDVLSARIVPVQTLVIEMAGGNVYRFYYPEKGSTWAVNEIAQGPTLDGMEETQCYEVVASFRFPYNAFEDMRSSFQELDSGTVDTVTLELAAIATQQKGAQMSIVLTDATVKHRSQGVRFRMGSNDQIGSYLEISLQAYLSADIWTITGSGALFQQVIGWI